MDSRQHCGYWPLGRKGKKKKIKEEKGDRMNGKRIEIYMSIKNFSQINRKKGKKENKAKQDRKRERETVRDSARMNTQVPCPLAAEANSSSPSSLAPLLPLELVLAVAASQLSTAF